MNNWMKSFINCIPDHIVTCRYNVAWLLAQTPEGAWFVTGLREFDITGLHEP